MQLMLEKYIKKQMSSITDRLFVINAVASIFVEFRLLAKLAI
jgi:hypothetical protein